MAELDPDSVVLDLVLRWSPSMRLSPNSAFVRPDFVHLLGVNHLGEAYSVSVPISPDGDPSDGQEGRPLRFRLFRLGPTVWKVTPSVRFPRLHAYLTIVGCPDPAPWETP